MAYTGLSKIQERKSDRDDRNYNCLALDEAKKISIPNKFIVRAHLRCGDCSKRNPTERINHYTNALNSAKTLKNDDINLSLQARALIGLGNARAEKRYL